MLLTINANHQGAKIDWFKVELDAEETYKWANRPLNKWPLSQVSDHKLMVEFNKTGLIDLKIDGEYKNNNLSSNELNSIIWNHLPNYIKKQYKDLFPYQDLEEE